MIWPKLQDSVLAVTSTKAEGDLSFKWGTNGTKVIQNRKHFFNELKVSLDNLVACDQPHGNNILTVDKESLGRGAYAKDWLLGFDGFVTKENEVILGIETADCVPIFMFDPISRVVGLAHAGWRGVISNISQNLVTAAMKLGCSKENILILIGPHIKSCCFEVQSDLIEIFSAQYSNALKIKQGNTFIDLSAVVMEQLSNLGIPEKNVIVSTDCTCCQPNKYYSFRRDKKDCEGSMLSIIKLL